MKAAPNDGQGAAGSEKPQPFGTRELETLGVCIFRTDDSGSCTYVNPSWSELTGLSREAALGSGWTMALHEADRDRVWQAWQLAQREGSAFHTEYRLLRQDGSWLWVLGEARPVVDAQGSSTGYIGTLTDISALKSAEEALIRAKELNENIIGSSVDGILAFDRDCRYTVWNPAMEHLTGVSAREALGRCAFDVFPFLRGIGEDWYFEEALAGRYAVARDREFTVPSTGHHGFFEAHYTPVRNARGEVVGGLAIVRDMTEIKGTQAQLLQAGKLAAMGQLGAGIAHELNQPLTGIQLLLSLIRQEPSQTIGERADDFNIVSEQVMRMGKIVDNVRAFARKSTFQPQPIAATQPLEAAALLMAEQMRLNGIQLNRAIEANLPPIFADPTQLQQVFLNLLSNALHALQSHPGTRVIEVSARKQGDRIEFRVEDSGPGVPEEVQAKVFDPFFTTKEPGTGTGLGLSLCYGIVQEHRGEIHVGASNTGGAQFTFAIPIAEAPPEEHPVEPEPKREPSSTHRVLVVDDEALLRRVVARCLDDLGYEFQVVGDAQEALDLAERENYDLALVDLKMPGIDGGTLCARLREVRPKLELVVMSGFVHEEQRGQLLDLGVRQILPKPFTKALLGEALREALAERDLDAALLSS